MNIMLNRNRIVLLIIFLLLPISLISDNKLDMVNKYYEKKEYLKAARYIRTLIKQDHFNYTYKIELAKCFYYSEDYYTCSLILKLLLADDWMDDRYRKELQDMEAKLELIPDNDKKIVIEVPEEAAGPVSYDKRFHAFYLDAYGAGFFNSFSYEYIYFDFRSTGMAFRGGIGVFPNEIDDYKHNYYSFPLTISWLFGNREKHGSLFEIGGGGTLLWYNYESEPYWSFVIGYRYIPREGGLSFKLYLAPWIARSHHPIDGFWSPKIGTIFIPISLGVGYCF